MAEAERINGVAAWLHLAWSQVSGSRLGWTQIGSRQQQRLRALAAFLLDGPPQDLVDSILERPRGRTARKTRKGERRESRGGPAAEVGSVEGSGE